jgi:hypothetical protein
LVQVKPASPLLYKPEEPAAAYSDPSGLATIGVVRLYEEKGIAMPGEKVVPPFVERYSVLLLNNSTVFGLVGLMATTDAITVQFV